LGADIPIVEHLTNLGALPDDGFRFFAVPPRIVRGASFPVRAFAELPG
jgi:kynurenine formamidase